MDKARIPSSYKISRPADESDLSWDAIEVMWDHVNFYEDEAAYRRSLAPATRGQIAVYACTWYLREVDNGGHEQFFFNSTGIVWQDALDGFELLGGERHRAVLLDAVSVFANSSPSFDRKTRIDQLNSIDTSVFDELDDRLYNIDEDLDALVRKYIRANPAQFFAQDAMKE